ncbi:UDP-glucose dehydrogenase family protein [Solemya elarraichensis gill symbiont]|uniref:UDP-glucose 6-dehydrogenase n=1 Tax=Solemya elarraichensis gill symbiont TaxID=1918949 RepID=A0A1T2LBJ5_9GAMM|nr:UDP-glucose/GDP-mannose dehydrogenase family protein [Solemya elarraichensis gill symbiont]OOZ42489.1 UDP-glucose 6-dehydrogenase [Solemya elarraichensis gill symbiont]
MKVSIYGSGYVGLVTGACLADVGHHVLCVDVDESKIALLKSGGIPIYEPGLDAIVKRCIAEGTLEFTTSAEEGTAFADVQFIAVGTPPDEDGSADLQYVLAVANSIATHMDRPKIIIDKSTVPVGTADRVSAKVRRILDERGLDIHYDVCSNPEFLKEGSAIPDFMKPDRIVIGSEDPHTIEVMRELYEPFNRNHERLVIMDVRSAELTKYAANAMLATKISFMNEISNLAERLGADVENVRRGIGSDPRIGFHFIYPGCGYGGSCFPKDVKALASTAKEIGYHAELLNAVEGVNERQKAVLLQRIKEHFGDDLTGKRFAIWGLSFKPETDDMREASSRVTIAGLLEAGATVCAYDPVASEEAQRILGDDERIEYAADKHAATEGADALIIHTEWKAFRVPELDVLEEKLNNKVIFDGRNLYAPEELKTHGWTYYAIGRGDSVKGNA